MAAAYPKPDDERRTRHEPKFGWVNLEPHTITAPTLPPLRSWSEETLRWWAELWSKPQASQWDPSGSSAVPMAVLYQDVQDLPDKSTALLGELRQHEDRHGLNPKAMLQLRWRFVDAPEPAPVASTAGKKASTRRERVLAIVPGDAS